VWCLPLAFASGRIEIINETFALIEIGRPIPTRTECLGNYSIIVITVGGG